MRDLLQLRQARQDLEFALSEARAIGSEFWLSSMTAMLTSVEIAAGQFEQARRLLDSDLEVDCPSDSLGRRQMLSHRAELQLELGNLEEALSIINLLEGPASDKNGESGVVPHLALLHARALIKRAEYAAAELALKSARERAEALGYRPVLWRIEQEFASLYRLVGDRASAERHAENAVAIVRALAGDIADAELRDGFVRDATISLESTRT